MFKEKLDEFLKRINIIAAQFPISSKEVKIVQNSETAIPIKIKKKGKGLTAFLEKTDLNLDYPYTAKTLGSLLGKNQNFIAKTAENLEIKNDTKYAIKIKNPAGIVVMIKYSNDALNFLKKFLDENPGYNPYK